MGDKCRHLAPARTYGPNSLAVYVYREAIQAWVSLPSRILESTIGTLMNECQLRSQLLLVADSLVFLVVTRQTRRKEQKQTKGKAIVHIAVSHSDIDTQTLV
jgi:hypothetical protein